MTTVPGLFQTAEYARARFEEAVRVHGLPSDVEEAVRARLRRQDVLYRPDKRFRFVVTEAALRFRLCPDEAMLAQLERLVALSAMRNVELGIVGFDAKYVVSPRHGFWIHDDDLVTVETHSAGLNLDLGMRGPRGRRGREWRSAMQGSSQAPGAIPDRA